MRVVEGLVGNYIVAGLLISTVATTVALYLLHRLVADDFGSEVADRSVLYLALAPTAFFLLAPYSEALFLAFSVGMFLAMRRGRFVVAGALASLAILTRNQGVYLLVPLALEAGILMWRRRTESRRPVTWDMLAGLVSPIVTGVAYYLWLRFSLGFPGGAVEVQEAFWRSSFGHPATTFMDSTRVVLHSLWDRPFEFLNLVAALLLTVSLPLMFRRGVRPSYMAYAAVSAAGIWWRESAFTPLLSADRFVLVVFPLFVLLALAGRRAWLHQLVICLFGCRGSCSSVSHKASSSAEPYSPRRCGP
jgi:hypothetical protein